MRELLLAEPEIPPGEVWRRLREGGTPLGLSTAYRVLGEVRQQIPAEVLVRSLLASFEASGGVPLRVVFDNPKTVVIGREQGRPVWNATLAQVVLDYGFAIELCARNRRA